MCCSSLTTEQAEWDQDEEGCKHQEEAVKFDRLSQGERQGIGVCDELGSGAVALGSDSANRLVHACSKNDSCSTRLVLAIKVGVEDAPSKSS